MLAMEPMAPRTDRIISEICIASLGKYSRESFLHPSIPLPRDDRQPSFTAHRLQRRKNSTWTVGFHLKSIIQYSVVLSNELRHLRFLKVPRERMLGTGIKITEFPLDNSVLLCYCMNTLIQQYRRHEM